MTAGGRPDGSSSSIGEIFFINLINYKLRDKSEVHLNDEHDVPNISLSSDRIDRSAETRGVAGRAVAVAERESDVSE